MPAIQINERLLNFLFFLPFFFLSLAIHEFAHAFAAYRLGDTTAKSQGRLTLNPLKHLDLIGSLVMPLMAFASGFALIGWAKPVPVNPNNFRNPLKDDAIVSFAGPFSNFLLSLLFFVVLIFLFHMEESTAIRTTMMTICIYGMYLNLFLFLFNLLPIPPLDGSHILYDLFPNSFTQRLIGLGFYGSFILLLFVYSPLWNYFSKFLNFLLDLFLKLGGIR